MLSNTVISLIRTYTPVIVGFLLTWLASSLKIVVSPSSQAGLVAATVAVLTTVYYTLARLAEKYVPALGFLLGVPAQPAYPTTATNGAPNA